MVSVGLTFVPVATMTYVSDCYLPVNADALELVNGLKVRSPFHRLLFLLLQSADDNEQNIVAFGFLYGVVPWVMETGYINAFGAQAGIYVAILLLAVPVIVFGKQIRHRSAQWRVIL